MKPHRLLILALAAAASTVGFGAPLDPAAAPHFVTVNPNSSDSEIVSVRKAGEEALNRLGTQLIEEINSAVTRRGEEAALDVAHLKQVTKVNGQVEGLPGVVGFRATSYRVRAAKNRPDVAELAVLQQFIADIKAGRTLPEVVVQRIDGASNNHEWRVYKPLMTQAVCLNCHGDLFNKPASFREKLATRYPIDQAIEYNSNEWRGILRVTVDLTPPSAQKTVAAAAKPDSTKK